MQHFERPNAPRSMQNVVPALGVRRADVDDRKTLPTRGKLAVKKGQKGKIT